MTKIAGTVFAIAFAVACEAGGLPALFPETGPATLESVTAVGGPEKVKAVLDSASIPYAEFTVLQTDAGPVIGFTVDAAGANRVSNLDRKIWRDLGGSLIICGENDCLREMKDHVKDSPSPTEIIRNSKLSLSKWAADRRKSDPKYFKPERRKASSLQPRAHAREEIWVSVLDEPLSSVGVFVLPSTASWTAAAYLPFGGWNECPEPAVQVAFARYLAEAFGAEVVGFRFDSIRYRFDERRPEKSEALRLAWETFLYCPDKVHQGVGTLEDLAELLMGSSIVDFWWD